MRWSMGRREFIALVLLAIGLSAWSTFSCAAHTRELRDGVLEGVDYHLSMPANWNGGLIMFAHGYEGEATAKGTVRSSPLDFYLSEHGYAWAASGYRSWGYRPDWFLADTLALRAMFVRTFARHSDTRHIRYNIEPGYGVDVDDLNRAIVRIMPAPGA